MLSCPPFQFGKTTMSATFVLSPGRCGTQWLSQQFQSVERARVTHEPLHFDYEPLHNSPAQPLKKNSDRLITHLNTIHDQIKKGIPYLECGFPCWRHLSWFQRELGDETKVIYIHRDPVANATSLLKLNAFVPPLLPHLAEKQLFHPSAPNALLPEYVDYWPQLSPFEKCLYYWAEVNLQAELYQELFAPTHWLTIPYSDLFCESTLRKIAEFTNLPFEFQAHMLDRVDRYNGQPQSHVYANQIFKHPKILAVASRLNYAYMA
jgi:hypothetical protein